MNFFYTAFIGFISGIAGGMGLGGGTLLIPLLTLFLDFEQKNAQAINLFVFIPMAIFAIIIHFKNKLVDFKVGLSIIISGICFSIIGSLIANSINNNNLKRIFGVFLIFVGLYQITNVLNQVIKGDKNKFKFRFYIK